MTPLLHLLRALALAAAAAPATAAVVDIVWDAQGRFQRQDTVAPGRFVEVCGTLPRGLAVAWSFEADRPLDFNIHHHVGQEVVYSARLAAAARGGDTLRVPVEQDHCWMWRNTGSLPARLDLRLSRP